jgi:Tfp pilus assembly protein PilF
VQSIQILPLSGRISNALLSYIVYIGKTIWPNNLAYFYPYPKFWQPWQVLGAALILIAITLLIIQKTKRFQYLTVGWLWYIGTLVPVIGFIQVGSQARADRYTYIPLIGLFVMTVWGIPVLLKKWRYQNKVLIAFSTLTLSGLFIVTWTQVGYWQNSLTLSNHALKATNYNYIAYLNRGNAYKDLGNYSQAIVDYDKAIELDRTIAEAYFRRGNAYIALGNEKQAIEDYDRAIEINPTVAEFYINRADIYAAHGNEKQAIEDAKRAIEINPTIAEAYIIRGNAYKGIGNDKQAIVEFDRAIEINPKFAKAYNNRGNTYASIGNYKQAILDYDRAIDLDPTC